jgi:hypothetical protein
VRQTETRIGTRQVPNLRDDPERHNHRQQPAIHPIEYLGLGLRPVLLGFHEADGRRDIECVHVPADCEIIEVHFLQCLDAVVGVVGGQGLDHLGVDLVREEQVVFLEAWLFQLPDYYVQVLLGWADEVDGFEVRHLVAFVGHFLD